MNCHDVGVIDLGRRSRLAQEALLAVRPQLVGGKYFDCDFASQNCVASAIHHTHAALAELRLDPVVTESLTDHGLFVPWDSY